MKIKKEEQATLDQMRLYVKELRKKGYDSHTYKCTLCGSLGIKTTYKNTTHSQCFDDICCDCCLERCLMPSCYKKTEGRKFTPFEPKEKNNPNNPKLYADFFEEEKGH